MLKLSLPLIAALAYLCLSAGPARATLTQCPAGTIAGVAFTGCNTLFVENLDGSFSTSIDSTQAQFNDGDDQYVGFQNNSTHSVAALKIDGGTIQLFAFDQDGPNSIPDNEFAGFCPTFGSGLTGYEGPDNTYSHVSSDCTKGEVDFNAAIAPGQSTYFFLEEVLTTDSNPITIIDVPLVPEPASLLVFTAGLGMLNAFRVRSK